jgi:uncharacterized NAD(P)/FAD-binding protein YdhS
LDVASAGEVRDVYGIARGRLFTLGSPRKGMLMETTAVPELRVQARDLATRLRSEKPADPATVESGASSPAMHAFAFEI